MMRQRGSWRGLWQGSSWGLIGSYGGISRGSCQHTLGGLLTWGNIFLTSSWLKETWLISKLTSKSKSLKETWTFGGLGAQGDLGFSCLNPLLLALEDFLSKKLIFFLFCNFFHYLEYVWIFVLIIGIKKIEKSK